MAAVAVLGAASGCGVVAAAPRERVRAEVLAARRPAERRSESSDVARWPAVRRSASAGGAPFAVGERILRLVDHSRRIRLPGGRLVPRPVTTIVRYPALGPATGTDRTGAAPDRAAGPFGLVVFGHGFAVTPRPYAALLRAWTRAGFIVAAPIFPLENANAPGGPDEDDLVNQPRDMRFVISSLLGLSRRRGSLLQGMIDSRRIAVSGQSDGGETALFTAYVPGYRDLRVRAAVILSGAVLPHGPFRFPRGGPALLATQGTADTINPPRFTDRSFALARRPKFLLALLGAGHLPPYTTQQPQLSIVARVSVAFLRGYLDGERDAASRVRAAAHAPGIAALSADP
ncbi:MAG: hypothetical protein JOZ07_11955 [Solirubrobacterales bacterium]|nr:hypothetical protein [Solirubrobacterales bacterium]